jgi:sugar O-acyltransferase (sialic acid O-acetyltransferase NeuD family)
MAHCHEAAEARRHQLCHSGNHGKIYWLKIKHNNMKKIAVFGAGGFGREVKMLIDQVNDRGATYEFVGFFDDSEPKGKMINGYPVLGGRKELNEYPEELCIAYAVGNPATKKKIVDSLTNSKISTPTLVHPSVYIGKDDVAIGEGCIICAGCIITVNIRIGNFVILNLGCTVGHDTVIEDHASFMPSVNISGEVVIREGVYAGTGAKIINQLEIGAYTIIGAGAVVSKTLPEYCTAVGIPAKPIKFHNVVNN